MEDYLNSVSRGLTFAWNSALPGKESFPSPIPRSERMTETKCMQVDFSNGKLEELVSSFTSAVDMFPTTLFALSTTGTLVRPSLLMSWSASVKGLSPLCLMSILISEMTVRDLLD